MSGDVGGRNGDDGTDVFEGVRRSVKGRMVRSVTADEVNAATSAMGFVRAGRADIATSAVGAAMSAHTEISKSYAVVAAGGNVRARNCLTQWIVGGYVEARNVMALAVVGGAVSGEVRALFGTKSAIAFGLALGMASFVSRLLRKFL